jgi:general secretion pathway protein K
MATRRTLGWLGIQGGIAGESLVNTRVKPSRQRGAALLVALLIAALVSVTLSMMLARQSALAGIEWQLRETAQARRILQGAEDWALLILREDARRSAIDHLGEPWAIPLQEGRLADFLKSAGDANSYAADLANSRVQDVWLSGRISDAQARYNLMRLAAPGAAQAPERALWLRVAAQAGLPAELARSVAARFAPPPAAKETTRDTPAAIHQPPVSLAHLVTQLPALAPWAGALSTLVVVLPEATPINVNTAAKPVLLALLPALDEKLAARFIELRVKAPWRDLAAVSAAFPETPLDVDATQATVASRYFTISAQARLGADPASATEVGVTTLIERLPQENRARVVRRDFGTAPNVP